MNEITVLNCLWEEITEEILPELRPEELELFREELEELKERFTR